ncbi:MAG TPA: glutamate--tRNA ligase family protein [Gemmatimonadaceae bacterium]|nr:glutamate--tRNA ligase family protein [Gemmatimonadaceae bacterium]
MRDASILSHVAGSATSTGARPTGASLGSRLPAPGWRTRFAPAPTGYLHLGHLVNAIHVWGIARAFGGRVLLRLEDHDRSRCRPEYEQALLDDLDWFGFVPDEAPTSAFRAGPTPHRQSDNTAAYERALDALSQRGVVYPCVCSRRDILQVTGPVPAGVEARYPGTCRVAPASPSLTHARRVALPERIVHFDDLRLGAQTQHPSRECGDVLVRDRDGNWTYQFAVVVDDRDQGIDVVIRGEDLLASTGRQLLLAELLGRASPPRFLHHPLLVHTDGRKLSKAAADTGLRALRAAGASAASLIGLAAHRAGLLEAPRPLSAGDVATLFA